MYTLKKAKLIAGNVQEGNTKILGSTWSIPPTACKVGSKLRTVKGSTCEKCYDFHNYNMYPSVRQGRGSNLDKYQEAKDNGTLQEFSEALARQIDNISQRKLKKGTSGANLHRWFTGGDLQDREMLECFVYVAKLLPHIKFWLPTREKAIVNSYLRTNLEGFPKNLTVRLSAAMIDTGKPVSKTVTSTVHTKVAPKGSHECPAYKQGGNCGTCTACWSSEVNNVSYKAH